MRLLADRDAGGIVVRLFWDDAAGPEREAVVKYQDQQEGLSYQLRVPGARALDAFYHPNAYLDAAEMFFFDHSRAA
jgi:hypothetical protein